MLSSHSLLTNGLAVRAQAQLREIAWPHPTSPSLPGLSPLLCLQSKSKIYVAKRVWDDHSVRLRDLEPGAAKHSREEQSQTLEQLSGTAALTTLRFGPARASALSRAAAGTGGL